MQLSPLPRPRLAPGKGPFGVRGIVVSGVVGYTEHKVEGGAAAVRALLPEDTASYLDRSMFLASTLYDLSPLGEYCCAAAKLLGSSPSDFIRERSRRSAIESIEGVYRTQLAAGDPKAMAGKLPRIFKRFFDPCEAEATRVGPDEMAVQFRDLPEPLAAFYAWSTEGFVGGALEVAGAKSVGHAWGTPQSAGMSAGVRLINLELVTSWS